MVVKKETREDIVEKIHEIDRKHRETIEAMGADPVSTYKCIFYDTKYSSCPVRKELKLHDLEKERDVSIPEYMAESSVKTIDWLFKFCQVCPHLVKSK